jgi:hypothetical protein
LKAGIIRAIFHVDGNMPFVPPAIPSRTDALLSNIYITEHDAKDILQTLKIGKACGDDGITHQIILTYSVIHF